MLAGLKDGTVVAMLMINYKDGHQHSVVEEVRGKHTRFDMSVMPFVLSSLISHLEARLVSQAAYPRAMLMLVNRHAISTTEATYPGPIGEDRLGGAPSCRSDIQRPSNSVGTIKSRHCTGLDPS